MSINIIRNYIIYRFVFHVLHFRDYTYFRVRVNVLMCYIANKYLWYLRIFNFLLKIIEIHKIIENINVLQGRKILIEGEILMLCSHHYDIKNDYEL